METIGKILLVGGIVVAAVGLAFFVLGRLGVERLPGDFVLRRGNFTLYAPLGLMLVLSVLLTIALTFLARR